MTEKRYETPDFQEKYGHLLGHLNDILNLLHEGVCISNAEGIILKMNPMYEKLSGLRPEALLGKKVSFLNSKEGVFDEAEPNAEQIEQQKGIFMGAVSPLILKSKRPANSIQQTTGGRKNLLHGYPLLNDNGDIELIVTFIRDISHLTLFKEQMASHQDILNRFRPDIHTQKRAPHISSQFIMESPKMNLVAKQLQKIAPTDATVLILGDTGVGKGEIARQIHGASTRSENTFFNADCTSIPDSLIESELFGYAPGAFSGANRDGKKGYFDIADNGTIFLDEIGELPVNMQAKLLRVLQDQEIMQIGSTTPKKVNVRIIAATNVNLEEAVAKGTFRQDLYYRLHVSVLRIPPLTQRIEDILPLTALFLQRYNTHYRKRISFAEESLKLLLNHKWPGNVRELQNMIQGLVITHDTNVIKPCDLPSLLPKLGKESGHHYQFMTNEICGQKSLKEIVAAIELEILQRAMEKYGSMTQVGKRFQLNRTTVSRKLEAGKKRP